MNTLFHLTTWYVRSKILPHPHQHAHTCCRPSASMLSRRTISSVDDGLSGPLISCASGPRLPLQHCHVYTQLTSCSRNYEDGGGLQQRGLEASTGMRLVLRDIRTDYQICQSESRGKALVAHDNTTLDETPQNIRPCQETIAGIISTVRAKIGTGQLP